MQTDTRLGTFAALLEPHPEPLRELARAARDLVLELDPDTFEVPRVKENAATYGVGPSKMKQAYCYVMLTRHTVNLGFFHATSLADPDGRLEGTGAKMRHLKLRERADLDDPYVRGLLVDAIADRRR